MCGIAGIVAASGQAVDPAVLDAMTETLVHRGPDGRGTAIPVPHVGLGHRRLSIIDLEGGAQPMAAADGRLWITFNGEIFNFRELRGEFEARGRRFATRSDTEVLLACYELDGERGLRRLRGQFGFVIWDGRGGRERVVAMRDPLGIKPLHFSFEGGLLLFGSEPRAILAHPAAPRRPDPFALHLYLRYRYVPAPLTAWQGIQKLRPGELLILEDGRLRLERTWRIGPEEVECEDDPAAARRAFAAGLERAVGSQQVADVPIAAFLSGGMDSSTIAAVLANRSAEPIATFTIGFESARYDESPFAAEVAARIGSRHHCVAMRDAEAATVIDEILAHLDEPFGDPSLVPTWLLCRGTAPHFKVVLSGDGGDELLGGYGHTWRALGVLEWPRALRPLYPLLRRLRRPGHDPARWHGDDRRVAAHYLRSLQELDAAAARRLYGPVLRAQLGPEQDAADPLRAAVARFADAPPFSRVLLADLESHLADLYLAKVERASMAHGLEVRVPFLDQDLVERCARFTAGVRLSGGRVKGLMKDTFAPLLPATVLDRPKKGFGPPLKLWFHESFGARARRELTDGALVQQGLIDAAGLERLLAPRRGSPKASRLWRLLILEHWLRRQAG
jgi:asparagine synthase (glutamine-hydrolysing)